jgi:hypothetical protein
MHLVLEELKSIPSFGLNTIEGKIGFMEQFRSGVSMRGGKRYPDAHSDRNLLPSIEKGLATPSSKAADSSLACSHSSRELTCTIAIHLLRGGRPGPLPR